MTAFLNGISVGMKKGHGDRRALRFAVQILRR
jgi:hypothetical protein